MLYRAHVGLRYGIVHFNLYATAVVGVLTTQREAWDELNTSYCFYILSMDIRIRGSMINVTFTFDVSW